PAGSAFYPKNLGDGFLYRYNPIYRAVRDEFLRLGYRLSRHDRIFYGQLKLLALPSILKTKTLPVHDNVTALKHYDALYPNRILMSDVFIIPLQKNFLLHEQAHCVIHAHLFGTDDPGYGESSARNHTLRILICEAFATTMETLGGLFIDSREHDFFYRLNAYNKVLPPPLRSRVERLVKRHGL